jgi:lactoylglutathione lyase
MARMIHSMIRVLDEARSLAFYGGAFGLEVADRYEFDDFTLIYLTDRESGFELELTVNKDQSEPYDLGRGYGHLAVSVADLGLARQTMLEKGMQPGEIRTLGHPSGFSARFFFVSDPDGYRIEVLERSGRFL